MEMDKSSAQQTGAELQKVNEQVINLIKKFLDDLQEKVWKHQDRRAKEAVMQNFAKELYNVLEKNQTKTSGKENIDPDKKSSQAENIQDSDYDFSEEDDGLVSHFEEDYSFLDQPISASSNLDENATTVNLNKEDSYDLSIEKDGKVIYAQNENHEELKGELSQSDKQGVHKAINTPVGETTELSSLKIQEKNRVVLQTDENGKVTVNDSTQYQDRFPKPDALQIAENKTEQLNSNSISETKQLLMALIKEVQSLPKQERQEESTKQLNQGDFYYSGSFQPDNNSSEINENMKRIEKQNQFIIQALQEREKHKRNPNWFSQTANQLSSLGDNIVSQFTGFRKDARAAKLVRNLIDETGKDTYHANNYTIKKQGRFYTLSDSKGKELLDFKVTALGVKVLDNKLQKSNYRDIEMLKEQVKSKDTNLGNFNPYGRDEILKEKRLSALTEKITNCSIAQGKSVTIEGQNYRWTATPNGDIQINSRGKTEAILLKTGNKVINRMSDRDLAFFEERFQSMENSSQIKQQAQQAQQVDPQPAPTNNVVPINHAKSKQKSNGIEL